MIEDEIFDRLKGTRVWSWGQLIEKAETGEYRPVKWCSEQGVYEALYEVQELCRQIKEEDSSPAKVRYKTLTNEVLTTVSRALTDSVVMSYCRSGERPPQERLLHEFMALRAYSQGDIELRYAVTALGAKNEAKTDGSRSD